MNIHSHIGIAIINLCFNFCCDKAKILLRMHRINYLFIVFVTAILICLLFTSSTFAQERKINNERISSALPKEQNEIKTIEEQSYLLGFDFETKEEFTINITDTNIADSFNSLDGSSIIDSGNSENLLSPSSFRNLTRVTSPDKHPWSVNVKLHVSYWIGRKQKECSGVLIDPKHVLTVGHCLYVRESGFDGWVDSIGVTPALNNYEQPFGYARAVRAWTWYANRDGDYYKNNIGFIELDRPVGALTGWHGFGFNNDDNFFRNNTFYMSSYPSDSIYDGRKMYSWSGRYDAVYDYQVVHHSPAGHNGMDGGGAYYIGSNNNRIVYSVYYGEDRSTNAPLYTRIRGHHYTGLVNTITENIPNKADLIPLGVSANPESIVAGEKLSDIRFLLLNYSEKSWKGNTKIKVYLSDNNVITSQDLLLKTINYNRKIAPMGRIIVNLDNPRAIPINKQGIYFIGIILENDDHNSKNNITKDPDLFVIDVKPFTPSPPANVNASDGKFTERVEITWNSTKGATKYNVYRADDPVGFYDKEYLGTTDSERFDDRTAEADTTYYYFVVAEAANGRKSPFSKSDSGWAKLYDVFLPVIFRK